MGKVWQTWSNLIEMNDGFRIYFHNMGFKKSILSSQWSFRAKYLHGININLLGDVQSYLVFFVVDSVL